jgi:hypothetical protein
MGYRSMANRMHSGVKVALGRGYFWQHLGRILLFTELA